MSIPFDITNHLNTLAHQIWSKGTSISTELDKVGSVINLVTAATTVILTLVTTWLTLIILRLTAKPSIAIRMYKQHEVICESEIDVIFHVYNRGRWYGHPPATEVRIYVNVEPTLSPIRLRYGSNLEKEDSIVKIGKGGLKYLRAKEITLSFEEPGEDIVLRVRAPNSSGSSAITLSANSAQGGYTIARFKLRYKEPIDRVQTYTRSVANRVPESDEIKIEVGDITSDPTLGTDP
jgi:hypothetical protein